MYASTNSIVPGATVSDVTEESEKTRTTYATYTSILGEFRHRLRAEGLGLEAANPRQARAKRAEDDADAAQTEARAKVQARIDQLKADTATRTVKLNAEFLFACGWGGTRTSARPSSSCAATCSKAARSPKRRDAWARRLRRPPTPRTWLLTSTGS